jgi:deoxyribonuclease-4
MPKFGVARKNGPDLRRYIASLGQHSVDAFEIGYAFGIPESIPREAHMCSLECGVSLSGHLPFWINLGNAKREQNLRYLVSGLRVASMLDSVSVFHLGFYGAQGFGSLKQGMVDLIRAALREADVATGKLGLETTGKQSAIGTCEEIIELVQLLDDERIIPIIDWSHLFARANGGYPRTYKDFREVLLNTSKGIGYKPAYFHGGGVAFKNGNEGKHLTAKLHQPPLPYLFAALQDLGYDDFTFIVESPDSLQDVKWLKEVWKSPSSFFDEIAATSNTRTSS